MINVSVIIPTWNNARRLAITLDAIARCRIPAGLRWEVIVVANNCTDDTAAVAADFSERLPLVALREPTPGSGIARNSGIAAARGGLLIFADDDVRPDPAWLDAYWHAFKQSGGDHFYGGPLSHEYEAEPDEAVLNAANRSIGGGLDLGRAVLKLQPGQTFMGANWAAPADAVRKVGGFDPELALDRGSGSLRAGEDVDLMERLHGLGLSGLYLPPARVVHFVPGYKCTLGYVSRHARALGAYALRRNTACTFVGKRPRLKSQLGENRWTAAAVGRLGVATIVCAMRWAARRVAKRPAHEDQVAFMYCVGRWQGYLEALERRTQEPRTKIRVLRAPASLLRVRAGDRETASRPRPDRGDRS